jgi:hypothetical protein
MAKRAMKSDVPQEIAVATPKHYAAGHLLGLVLFDFEAELGHDFLQVFPNVGFGGGIAQQIRG